MEGSITARTVTQQDLVARLAVVPQAHSTLSLRDLARRARSLAAPRVLALRALHAAAATGRLPIDRGVAIVVVKVGGLRGGSGRMLLAGQIISGGAAAALLLARALPAAKPRAPANC